MMFGKDKLGAEVKQLLALAGKREIQGYSRQQISALPPTVQKFFLLCLPEGQPIANYLVVEQEGVFRLKAQQGWLPITAKAHYCLNPPGFVWEATLRVAPFFRISVRDSFIGGKGSVLAKAYGLLRIAGDQGPEIDHAALARWLSEAVAFPAALLPRENLSWQEVDDHSARLVFSQQGIVIDALVYFGRTGEIVGFVTDRYCMETGKREKWRVYYKDYVDLAGGRLPSVGGAIWHLSTGDFHYARFGLKPV